MSDPTRPRRPSRPRLPVNPAAAALGVGVQPDKWLPEQIMQAITRRYLQLIQLAEEERARERANRARLFYAGAFEMAQLLSAYYQDMGRSEEYARWNHRRAIAQSAAYRVQNSIAEAIGTRTDPDPTSPPVTTDSITRTPGAIKPTPPTKPTPTRPSSSASPPSTRPPSRPRSRTSSNR